MIVESIMEEDGSGGDMKIKKRKQVTRKEIFNSGIFKLQKPKNTFSSYKKEFEFDCEPTNGAIEIYGLNKKKKYEIIVNEIKECK